MAVVFIAGFETGNANNYGSGGEAEVINGTNSLVTSPVRSGTYALRTNPTTTATAYWYFRPGGSDAAPTTFNKATLYSSFDFRVATAPSAGAEPIFWTHDTSAPKFELRIDNNRNLLAYDASISLLGTGTTVLALDTWYRIDVKVGTGASAAWEVQINGVSEPNLSGTTANLGTTNNHRVYLGKTINRAGNSVDYYYDNLIVDDAAFVSTSTVVTVMVPNASGSATTWSLSGGEADWQHVDELPATSTTDYLLSTGTVGNAHTVGFQSAADASIGDTIAGVQYYLRVQREAGTNGTINGRLVTGTTTDTSNSTTSSTASAKFKCFGTLPEGGSWTTSALDTVEVGAVEAKATATDFSRLHSVLLMVAHVPAAGQPRFVRNIGHIYTPARGRTGKWF